MGIYIASVLTSEVVLWVNKLQGAVLSPALVKVIRPTTNVCLISRFDIPVVCEYNVNMWTTVNTTTNLII